MKIKSIKQCKNLKNKTILVRCDFDLPLSQKTQKTKKQTHTIRIIDDSRLKALIPSIKYLLDKKSKKIILMGHLGRPKGKVVRSLSLEPVKERLEEIMKKNLRFKNYEPSASFRTGLRIKFIKKITDYRHALVPLSHREVSEIEGLQITDYKILMLENLRFYSGEEKNDQGFAKKLAALADIYVNESFATSHRSAASIDAIQNYLPSYAGLHLEQEIKNLNYILQKPRKASHRDRPKRPLVVIIGGAKIETKLPVIKNFLKIADYILVGGAVANTFFKAQGFEVGKSLVDEEYLKEAKKIIKALKHKNIKTLTYRDVSLRQIILPVDAIVRDQKLEIRNKKLGEINSDEIILDIGSKTVKLYCAIIKKAKTIVWNGPMGYFEDKRFAKGTGEIAKSILKNKNAKIVIGGGETMESIVKLLNCYIVKNSKNIFISIGGGAMLEYLAGKKLPGLKTICLI